MSLGRILILDDDPAVGQTISFIAENAGLESRATTDADSFFEHLESWDPHYIALDLVMPGMDGVEVMRLLAARGCSAMIIITSGVGSRVLGAAERSAAEHGLNVIGVVSKPFSARVFRSLICDYQSRVDLPTNTMRHVGSNFVVSEEKLRRALDQHEFVMAYQPKVVCDSGKLAGFEALVRWHHPIAGVVMPDRFIPDLEELGLMTQLTEQVLARSLDWFSAHFCEHQTAGASGVSEYSPLCLSINISAKNLFEIQFADRIGALCQDHGVSPSQLIFELTETSAMDDPILSLDLLTRLRVKGFQLSIDDFGTGYSSMVQLVRLPFSEIKVDKSFVMTASKSQESRTVIKSIVDLGRSLGLRTSAEGVEDADTLALLRDIGCDLAQGFYIARPMYGEHVLQWLSSRQALLPQGEVLRNQMTNSNIDDGSTPQH